MTHDVHEVLGKTAYESLVAHVAITPNWPTWEQLEDDRKATYVAFGQAFLTKVNDTPELHAYRSQR